VIFEPDCALVEEVCAARNYGDRRGEAPVDMIVLHYTGMTDGFEALAYLTGEAGEVSCHYLVHENGAIVQMVPESLRAWHAGVSHWRGKTDINSRSVGIEICNPGHDYGYRPFPDVQIGAVIALCADIVARHPVAPRNVVAHSDIAPARKRDPGELFPWNRLADCRIGHFVEPVPVGGGRVLKPGSSGAEVEKLRARLSFYGYGLEAGGRYDPSLEQCVTAFQRHFRPALVDGIADRSTVLTLENLIDSLPGSRGFAGESS
jgi:N-acetylmuramoyl-L-alanine amidase